MRVSEGYYVTDTSTTTHPPTAPERLNRLTLAFCLHDIIKLLDQDEVPKCDIERALKIARYAL